MVMSHINLVKCAVLRKLFDALTKSLARDSRTGNRLLGIEPKRTAPSQPISVKGTQVPAWVNGFNGCFAADDEEQAD